MNTHAHRASSGARPDLRRHRLARFAGALGLTALLGACATVNPKEQVAQETQAMRKGPESAPQRNISGFSDALRCMDSTFITYNVRNVSVLVEDITDQTKKVNAGTKDMLISAVSDMTKRSRAIRLVIYGQDAGNVVGYLREAERKTPYTSVPQFDIKGSVSQLDESMVKRQVQAGVSFGEFLSIGGGRASATNVLGIDLTVLTTENLSVVPGVTSRNSVVIFKSGQGLEADAQYHKFGANFGMSLSQSEGQTQALRTLVELAAIELLGKLTHTPYWTCLGANAEDPTVKNEISDWFELTLANPANLVGWFQDQLHNRSYYYGPVDGVPNDQLKQSVSAYRTALGLSPEPRLDLTFYSAYLNANHAEVLAKFPPPPPPEPVAANGPTPLSMRLETTTGAVRFKAGEAINLLVAPNRDAYVYCYWQDETNKIVRVYPNRFAKDPKIAAAQPLELPGRMKLQFFANDKHAPERVACFATEKDVTAGLPATVRGTDLEPLQLRSLDQVRDAFNGASQGNMTVGYLDVQAE
jgi:hypothetical protein